METTTGPVVVATVSAALFAITTNLQRMAASSVPAAGSGPVRLLRRLLTDRRWLMGIGVGAAALALHVVALAHGGVTVIQSVMALGLVIALGLEARRERRRLRRHEIGGAALVVLGVALVVAVGRPVHPGVPAPGPAFLAAGLVAGGALAAVLRSRRRVGDRWGARLLAAAGGACFAVDAVFLQRLATLGDTVLQARLAVLPGSSVLAAALDLGAFVTASLIGTVAVQRAYQVAPLVVVQPALAAAEPVTAFLVGLVVLHEGVRGGTAGRVLLVAGLVSLVAGIVSGMPRPARVAAGAAAGVPAARAGESVEGPEVRAGVPAGYRRATRPAVPTRRPARATRPGAVRVRHPVAPRLP